MKKYLGIQTGGLWDGKRIIKDKKKTGRKMDLQRTICIREMLVELGRYSNLTRYYNSLQPSIMELISWNIRGLDSPVKCRLIKNIIKQEKPQILFLQETKYNSISLD